VEELVQDLMPGVVGRVLEVPNLLGGLLIARGRPLGEGFEAFSRYLRLAIKKLKYVWS
jgi:hypothetical protein